MASTADDIELRARPLVRGSAVDHSSTAPYVWMLIAAAVFTAMGGFARALADRCDWLFIASVRTFLAMSIAVTCAKLSGQRLVFFRPVTLWMRSLAGSVSLLCTFFALGHPEVKLADVYTLTNTFPIWVALLSWPLLGLVPSREVWGAIAVGTAGVILIQRPYFDHGNVAALAAMFSAVTTGVAMIGLHRLGGLAPWAIVAHFSGVSCLCCLVGLALFGSLPEVEVAFAPSTLAMLLGLGVSAAIGQVLLTKSFAAGAPARVSVVSLSSVAMAMLLEAIVWQRTFDTVTLLGMALVLAPTAWLILRRESEKPLTTGT